MACDDVGDLSAVAGDGGDGCTSGGVLGLLSAKPSLTDGEDADAWSPKSYAGDAGDLSIASCSSSGSLASLSSLLPSWPIGWWRRLLLDELSTSLSLPYCGVVGEEASRLRDRDSLALDLECVSASFDCMGATFVSFLLRLKFTLIMILSPLAMTSLDSMGVCSSVSSK